MALPHRRIHRRPYRTFRIFDLPGHATEDESVVPFGGRATAGHQEIARAASYDDESGSFQEGAEEVALVCFFGALRFQLHARESQHQLADAALA